MRARTLFGLHVHESRATSLPHSTQAQGHGCRAPRFSSSVTPPAGSMIDAASRQKRSGHDRERRCPASAAASSGVVIFHAFRSTSLRSSVCDRSVGNAHARRRRFAGDRRSTGSLRAFGCAQCVRPDPTTLSGVRRREVGYYCGCPTLHASHLTSPTTSTQVPDVQLRRLRHRRDAGFHPMRVLPGGTERAGAGRRPRDDQHGVASQRATHERRRRRAHQAESACLVDAGRRSA